MDYNTIRKLIESFISEEALQTLNRSYGVEFEMCFDRDTLREFLNNNKNISSYYSSEEILEGHASAFTELLKKFGLSEWKATYDSSIYADDRSDITLEIVTPILSGEEGLYQIMNFLELVPKLGGYVNKSCGGHVHIGASDLLQGTNMQISNRFIVGLLMAEKFTPLLHALVPQERRDNDYANDVVFPKNSISRAYKDQDTEKEKSQHIQNLINLFASDRYKSINFQSLNKHGTIEFRIFEGTLDYRKIEERVRFGIAFVNALLQAELDFRPNILSLKDILAKANIKGTKTKITKVILREIYNLNLRTQKQMIDTIQQGLRYSHDNDQYASPQMNLLSAIASYPLYKKPINLLNHEIIIDCRSQKNLRKVIDTIRESNYGVSYKVSGNQLLLNPVYNKNSYEHDLYRILDNFSDNNFDTSSIPTPEKFLSLLDTKEAAPYIVSFYEYKNDQEYKKEF